MTRRLPAWTAPVVAALALRLALLAIVPIANNQSGDTPDYAALAHGVLSGYGFSTDTSPAHVSTFERPPTYPLLIALVWLVTGKSWVALGVVQCALDAAVVALLHDTALRRLGAREATLAAWLYALLPFPAGTAIQFMSEGLSGFAFVLAAWAATRARDAERAGRWLVLAGVAMGVSALTRPYLIPVGAVFGAQIALEQRRARSLSWARTGVAIALFGAACAAPFAPWVARNAWASRAYGAPFVLVQAYASRPPYTNMHTKEFDGYMASFAEPFVWTDTFKPPSGGYLSPEERAEVAALWVKIEAGNGVMTPEMNQAFARLTRERYRAAPLRLYVWRPVSMALKTWFSPRASTFRVSLDGGSGLAQGSRALLGALLLINASTTLLALIGVAVVARRSRLDAAFLAAAPLALTALLVWLATRETRLTMPLYGLLTVACAAGSVWLTGRVRARLTARSA
ncbi:MAG: glycosyltransferase family 39 protein [Polyangiaceae bacterium]|nr:glycosyltransferase family 39 protein [Polyangiaceae bacterium]